MSQGSFNPNIRFLITEIQSAPPVFFQVRDAVPGMTALTVEDVCLAAEEVAGYDRIAGAVKRGLLWRVHFKTKEDRGRLLTSTDGRLKITKRCEDTGDLKSFTVRLYGKTPLSSIDSLTGEEIEQSKLTIDGFLLSVLNSDIRKQLEMIPGLKVQSSIFYERTWLADTGTLGKWVNGRRYCYIDMPQEELPMTITVGAFKAKLYYRERPKAPQTCWACGEEGHKKGDIACLKKSSSNYSTGAGNGWKPPRGNRHGHTSPYNGAPVQDSPETASRREAEQLIASLRNLDKDFPSLPTSRRVSVSSDAGMLDKVDSKTDTDVGNRDVGRKVVDSEGVGREVVDSEGVGREVEDSEGVVSLATGVCLSPSRRIIKDMLSGRRIIQSDLKARVMGLGSFVCDMMIG